MKCWMFFLTLGLSVALFAEPVTYPGPDWKEEPNPLASAWAVPGGELNVNGSQYPKSLNYYLELNSMVARIFGLMYQSLLSEHPVTLQYEPGLARTWTVDDETLTYTFAIDERARWSDGQPVTAKDVQWTFDAVMAPDSLTGPFKVSLERFESPVVLDPMTIQFKGKERHWKNMQAVGGFPILPKHVFENTDFNRINFEFPVVGGPYRIDDLKEGRSMTLSRMSDWWARELPGMKHMFNFDRIIFHFYRNRDDAYAVFKKGNLDMFAVYTSHRWMTQTTGERFDKNWIIKQKVHNYNPVGFQGFAMNMRRKPFDDLRVRKALAHLLNREKMNEVLMYNQYFLLKSYYTDLYDEDHPCENIDLRFDPARARQLLEDAGWNVNPDTGFREKNGRRFAFTFLTRDPTSDKFLAIYKEDLQDAGIELKIERKDWAAWAKDMDEFNFDMTWAAWGAAVRKDPEGMWHSKEADRTSGNNITGFKSEAVDRLIEQQRTIYDVEKRHDLVRKIDKIVTDQVPYILLWLNDYTRLLYWNRMGTPPTVLNKYGDEGAAYIYWWADPDLAAELEEAREEGWDMPRVPEEIFYDQAAPSNAR